MKITASQILEAKLVGNGCAVILTLQVEFDTEDAAMPLVGKLQYIDDSLQCALVTRE